MTTMYVIRWRSTINGRAGKGSKLFSHEEAEQLVEELNHEYPQIQHEVVEAQEASGPEPGAAPQQESEPLIAPAPAGLQSEPEPEPRADRDAFLLP
jgi:hypothetical protein